MAQTLSVSDIANMIGVEENIISKTLQRRDDDLAIYMREPVNNQSVDTTEEIDASGRPSQALLLDLEGLPLLITKLAFNIPTSDIIENLACQVLHLMLIQEEKEDLERKKRELAHQNVQQQHKIKELQQKIETLETELKEQIDTASRRRSWHFWKGQKS